MRDGIFIKEIISMFSKKFLFLSAIIAANGNAFAVDELAEIEVSATKQTQPLKDSLADVNVISAEQIQSQAQNNKSLTHILSNVPGIQLSGESTLLGQGQGIYIRGTNSDQTQVLLDGVPINSLDLYGSPLRFLSGGDISKIEILQGNSSHLYGANAIGGVINIFTNQPTKDLYAEAFAGYGSNNTQKYSALISGGNDFVQGKIFAEHLKTDGISSQRYALSTSRDADNDGYKNNNFAVGVNFTPFANKRQKFGLNYRQTIAKVHYDSGSVPPNGNFDDRSNIRLRQFSAFADNEFINNEKLTWNSLLRFATNDDKQTAFSAYDADGSGSPTHSRTQFVSWQNSFDLKDPTNQTNQTNPEKNLQNSWKKIIALLEFKKDNGYFANNANNENYIAAPNITNRAFVLGYNAKYNGKHLLQINGRIDKNSAFGTHKTWNLAYGYFVTPNLKLRANISTAFKAPTLYQLYAENAAWSQRSNPNLQPEKSKNYELGVTYDFGDAWENTHKISATAFYNKVKNLISYVTDPVDFFGSYQNTNSATLKGVNVSWNGDFGVWNANVSYDYLSAKNNQSHFDLGRRSRHVGKIGANRYFGRWQVGSELQLFSRRFTDNNETHKLGGYGVVNLHAKHQMTSAFALEIRVDNIFDKRYENALAGIDFDSGKRYPYNTAGLTAFVGVRWSLDK